MRHTDLSGSSLGEYQIRSLLGRGGMAEVYQAYDPGLDREVAIKVIHTLEQPADFVERFRREARVIASLRHPHVVQVYQFGEQDNTIYMVQELLPGPTLARRIRRAGKRGVAMSRIIVTLEQLASALDYAHAQGVTHRDVKPGNALYNAQEHLVLTDFGIARSTADTSRTATSPGVVMGTPGYVAPEQAISSGSITPACDVYSLGVVLFEMLTGQLPFTADSPMEVVLQHLYNEPPPPSSLQEDLPTQVDKVVLRALAKEPEQRYASAGELFQAFQGAIAKKSSAARKTPGSTRESSTSQARSTPAKSKSASPTKAPASAASASSKQSAASGKDKAPRSTARSESSGTTSRTKSKRSASSTGATRSAARQPEKSKRQRSTKADAAKAPAAAPEKRRQGRGERIVLLLVLCIVGGLILFGLELESGVVTDAFQQARQIVGQ
jgi:serine/threonine-protein kinase